MKSSRFHYPPRDPGYQLDTDSDTDYTVWLSDPPAASWSANGGYHGSFAEGSSLKDAMLKAGFPDEIIEIFIDTIGS